MNEGRHVMLAAILNLQRLDHVKLRRKHKTSRAKHVKLCRDLLSLSQKLLSFRRILPSVAAKRAGMTETSKSDSAFRLLTYVLEPKLILLTGGILLQRS
jgi:hypothetical protein